MEWETHGPGSEGRKMDETSGSIASSYKHHDHTTEQEKGFKSWETTQRWLDEGG